MALLAALLQVHHRCLSNWPINSIFPQVALEYSGVKHGKTATVLRMEVSDVDGAASIHEFSQYHGEEEWLWNVLTYLQYIEGEGRDLERILESSVIHT